MVQLQRSALVAIAVLTVGFCIVQSDALAETSFHADRARLRRAPSVTVASGAGIPPWAGGQSEHSRLSGQPKKKLMDAINIFRAEICVKLKGLHGEQFDSFGACKRFMEGACRPGKDGVMDGDKSEITTRMGYCKDYFDEQEAEEELKKLEGEDKAKEDLEKLEEDDPLEGAPSTPALETNAPAAAAPASAAPASVPPGLAAARAPTAAPAPDEKWYFKEGGKWDGRLHMDGSLKLPSQGYWGKLVEHDDKESVTGDWGAEFGPKSKHRSYSAICKDFPDNVWCKRQGHQRHSEHKHSSAYQTPAPLIAFVPLFVAWVIDFP